MRKWIRRAAVASALLVVSLLVLVTAFAFLSDPKLRQHGVLAPDAARGVFTFADIPRGRDLPDAEIDGYVDRLLRGMTLDEKVAQMSGDQYPGMEGGNAIARVLLGDVNPSGKLTFTVAADPSWLPPFTPRAPSIEYGYYHGYTLAEKKGVEPAFAFGHGLSYTRFTYTNLQLAAESLPADGGSLEVSVDVTNSGTRAGREVVELYIGFPNAAVDRPRKLLRGFEKVPLTPGETRRVTFHVPSADLAYWDPSARAWRVEPVVHEVLVGGSSRQADLLSASFRVVP